jgi:hypothetical protein
MIFSLLPCFLSLVHSFLPSFLMLSLHHLQALFPLAFLLKASKFNVSDRYIAHEMDLNSFARTHAQTKDVQFDFVVSNPPYILPIDMAGLDPTVGGWWWKRLVVAGPILCCLFVRIRRCVWVGVGGGREGGGGRGRGKRALVLTQVRPSCSTICTKEMTRTSHRAICTV